MCVYIAQVGSFIKKGTRHYNYFAASSPTLDSAEEDRADSSAQDAQGPDQRQDADGDRVGDGEQVGQQEEEEGRVLPRPVRRTGRGSRSAEDPR